MTKHHHTKGDCPLLDDPHLYLDIGDLYEGPQAESVIDGTYVCPDDIHPALKILLRHLKIPLIVSGKEPPTLMSLGTYRESCKIVK